jgi:signal transduction histidine kinase
MRGVRGYVRSRLHRRIFVWFGASILATAIVAGVAAHVMGASDGGWRRSVEGAQRFLGGQLAEVWEDPARRDALAGAMVRDLGLSLRLEDARGELVAAYGDPCPRPHHTAPIRRGERLLGSAKVCFERRERRGLAFFGVLGLAVLTLWGASGVLARRLTRPLSELTRVANAIGGGNPSARVALRRSKVGELGELADSINDMADRIERQLNDQRELLAGVSHEIRSPLARLRVLAELAKDTGAGQVADDIEREILEIDSLVDQLLATSRLEFGALEKRPLDVLALAERALTRAGVEPSLLDAPPELPKVAGDPTLLSRALVNLLDNAGRHAGGVSAVVLRAAGDRVRFAVEDVGPGFASGDLERVFDRFVRGERGEGSSLGLGLALVRRIAEAHGGRAWAENREGGGARVTLELPVAEAG